ncbi:glycoside hydrolase family 12 protein [Moniliophthora roreri]|nr:glycoside hydrolase family 12 protein [Moniliophthora roreri]
MRGRQRCLAQLVPDPPSLPH